MKHNQTVNRTRRSLCLGSLLLSTSGVPFTSSAHQSNTLPKPNESVNYYQFYLAWKQLFSLSPQEYINRRQYEHNGLKSSEIVKLDFELHNVVEIESFILSKYEAAFVAHIGSFT
ncbi:hypothetical protein Patl_1182 [Paraglaciecola sp. T6c]|uniref:hypothetical protein n=1 Tax=Pseudoalteromonas atlantica (strain T6c / ATCC BAA-1087) TaxID=3042615 RepID=UPI00005C60CD|nr:hypothetical protein [Paraglaciecola sp. T6c]ABG39708.1 hypothetical protein Patl_1182 [Paraglaciecola sp. T6c]